MSGVPHVNGVVKVSAAAIEALIASGALAVSVRQDKYRDAVAITVDDTNAHDFAECDAIYIPNGGDLKVKLASGVTRIFTGITDCSLLPVGATRVFDTDTSTDTKTGLVALYYEVQS